MSWAWLALAGLGCGGPPVAPYADGVEIRKVAIMQGVDNVLFRQGEFARRTVPVIAQRAGVLRFYLSLVEDFEPRELEGTLTLLNPDGTVEDTLTSRQWVNSVSTVADLESTVNFRLEGEQIRQGTEFLFEVREGDVDREGEGGLEEDATFDSLIDARGFDPAPTDVLTLVILPITYQADGSNRVPDTSQEHIEEIRESMYVLYPTSEVVVRVEDPVNWPNPVNPRNGQQWGNLLRAVSDYAVDAEEETPNTYYYGLFDPAPSANIYCRQGGCTLGLSTLAVEAQDFPRASIGLGFRGVAASTLVHEVGHAHGLPHAPCGRPSQVDPDYPYPEGDIGVWGYSIATDQLRPDSRSDMMGYCSPIWISDYNFGRLHDRILELRDLPRTQPYPVTRLFVDETGATTLGRPVKIKDPAIGSRTVVVDLVDARGTVVRTVEGAFFPYTHFEGGSVVLDELVEEGLTAVVRR